MVTEINLPSMFVQMVPAFQITAIKALQPPHMNRMKGKYYIKK